MTSGDKVINDNDGSNATTKSDKNIEDSDNNKITNNESVKKIISDELDRLGKGGAFVWILFFLCVTPQILNGFHVSSYVFLGHLPDDMWCNIDVFKTTNWTTEQMRSISEKNLTSKGCTILDWNYTMLSKFQYEDAIKYTNQQPKPSEIPCTSFEYDDRESSIVPEWDLVCEKAVQRTSTQVGLSIGKFLGASTFGIISDKYGRRTSFFLGGIIYIVSSLIVTSSPWYFLFLIGRFGLGMSSSGLFYPAFALLTENISLKHRSWMSIAFTASYPIGMLFLALAAYLVHPWRYLQLTLTVPSFLLIINFILMNESPRWLLMKGRYNKAYKVIFKKNINERDIELSKKLEDETRKETIKLKDESEKEKTFIQKVKGSSQELVALFGQKKLRRLIFTCHFMWCVTSLCYYVTALNAGNLPVSRYLYVAITGFVDIPSYILPVILLRYMGRTKAACSMFIFAGIALLLMLAIPQNHPNILVSLAMAGRFGISGVYSILTLFTAELFPTQIRNSALGTSSTMAHVGSIIAPYIVDILGLVSWFIPTTICGIAIITAGLLILTLPETSTRDLSDHVNEENTKILQ